jgi:hypothetical protein
MSVCLLPSAAAAAVNMRAPTAVSRVARVGPSHATHVLGSARFVILLLAPIAPAIYLARRAR